MNEPTDKELVRDILDHKSGSLEAFLEKYGGRVHRILRTRYPRLPETEDALQEATFLVWDKIHQFDPSFLSNATTDREDASSTELNEGLLGAWFLTIAVRQMHSILRGEARHWQQCMSEERLADLPDPLWDEMESDTNEAILFALDDATRELSDLQRYVILNDLKPSPATDEELAEQRSTTVNVIQVTRYRALRRLRVLLEDGGHSFPR